MLKGFKILSVSHRHSKLDKLGQFLYSVKDKTVLSNQLELLKQNMKLDELMYLATCNRVMYFFYTTQAVNDDFIFELFQRVNPNIERSVLFGNDMRSFSFYEGEKAIDHLFKVSSSIDSMVVGEREILRQIRDAYEDCKTWQLTGDNIRLAMDTAVVTAKKIYANTKIGEKPVSVVSLAIQKMLETGMPDNPKILMIGAGQTNTLVTKFLRNHQLNNLIVYNRSLESAEKLVRIVGIGEPRALADIMDHDTGFDCLIVCTASTEPVVTTTMYQRLLGNAKSPKVVIDLSIPHNVAGDVATNFPMEYIEIDGLRSLAKENLKFRQMEVVHAKSLIADEIDNFHSLCKQRVLERAMQNIPTEIKAIKTHAMNEVFKKELATLDDDSRALLEKMMNYMEKRCIGIPMKAAKDALL